MKGFVGVTDNDWFAFLSQQLLLPKTPRHTDGGQALDLLTIALKINNAGFAFDKGQNK